MFSETLTIPMTWVRTDVGYVNPAHIVSVARYVGIITLTDTNGREWRVTTSTLTPQEWLEAELRVDAS